MTVFRRNKKRKERRLPENAERRQNWAQASSEVTPPEFRAAAAESVKRTVDRAKEMAQIVSVVTIRTKPKSG